MILRWQAEVVYSLERETGVVGVGPDKVAKLPKGGKVALGGGLGAVRLARDKVDVDRDSRELFPVGREKYVNCLLIPDAFLNSLVNGSDMPLQVFLKVVETGGGPNIADIYSHTGNHLRLLVGSGGLAHGEADIIGGLTKPSVLLGRVCVLAEAAGGGEGGIC